MHFVILVHCPTVKNTDKANKLPLQVIGGKWGTGAIGWCGSIVGMFVRWRRMNYGDRERGLLDREEWTDEINRQRLEVVVRVE